MANPGELLEAVRAHLVAEGIARLPGTAGPLPPLWLQPEGGAVAPGDKRGTEDHPDVVLSVMYTGGTAARATEPFLRASTVDFWYRSRKAPQALNLEAQVREELVEGDDGFGKRGWTMGGLLVHSTQEWRATSPVGLDAPGHAFVWAMFAEYWA